MIRYIVHCMLSTSGVNLVNDTIVIKFYIIVVSMRRHRVSNYCIPADFFV